MVKMDLKKVFVIGTAGFVVISLGLFYVLTNSTRITSGRSQREVNLENMERKLQSLEEAFQSHKMSMKELEKLAMSQQQNGGDHPIVESPLDNNNIDDNPAAVAKNNNDVVKINNNNNAASAVELGTCSASVGLKNKAASDFNMLDVYDLIKFDNQDGGVWKQGFKINPDSSRFTEANKLKVVVIPHSHNDPGWIKTFEKYFEDQTKHILDNMLIELGANPDLKFIWAEISYFNLWWTDLSTAQKKAVQKLVENKQLEFVTGGWVMPDEVIIWKKMHATLKSQLANKNRKPVFERDEKPAFTKD
ncbi:Alpha-mannosidase 2 [Folsomia candida]|uniref:Alpha-mannosidase 2 n=1 Tax=Folsomia candida TaxID=158441 RepID=A0A226EHB8_FOLCA|nr:Alpha-mannosidase 2 [Folsomia candida]